MKIDGNELLEQIKESMIKRDSYAEVHVMASTSEIVPYTHINLNSCNEKDIAYLVIALEAIIEDFEERYPKVKKIKSNLGYTKLGKVDM